MNERYILYFKNVHKTLRQSRFWFSLSAQKGLLSHGLSNLSNNIESRLYNNPLSDINHLTCFSKRLNHHIKTLSLVSKDTVQYTIHRSTHGGPYTIPWVSSFIFLLPEMFTIEEKLISYHLLFHLNKCDVIKQNESELANIDLDRANHSSQFPLYFIVLSITKIAISLEPYAQF